MAARVKSALAYDDVDIEGLKIILIFWAFRNIVLNWLDPDQLNLGLSC